jgi:amino acid transporter
VQKTVARAIIGAVAISGIVGMITLICFAISIPNLSAVASSPTPIAYLAQYWYGSAFSRIFLVTVVYSVFSLMVVQIAAIGRLIYSLSRDNMFPGSKIFARVDAKTKTPVAALILTTIIYIAVMVFAAEDGNAYVTLIGATPIFASFVYLMIVAAYWARRNRIPKSPAFDLGRWAVPLIVIALAWEIAIILDFTLPSEFHDAAEVAVAGQVVAALWYFGGLRSRLRRGVAGQALRVGQLAGKDALDAPAVGAGAPEAELGG